MTSEEKRLSHIQFKLHLHEVDKQAFEDVFTKVMKYKYSGFQLVKPQGAYGDRKNDGFIPSTGSFYQVYAPEDFKQKGGASLAEKKFEKDFDGLLSYWEEAGYSIKKFTYAIHDKYKGAYPSLYKLLQSYKKKYPDIDFEVMVNADLDKIFLSLGDEERIDIVGFPFLSGNIKIEFGVIKEVVDFLMRKEDCSDFREFLDVPDFDEKIKINRLSKRVTALLNEGLLKTGELRSFFEFNTDYIERELQIRFNNLYQEAKKSHPEDPDLMYFYIRKAASPREHSAIYQVIDILMAYYFEACDIFEPPLPK